MKKTSGSLFNYYRDEPTTVTGHGGSISNYNSKSFDYKSAIYEPLNPTANNRNIKNNLEIAIPLKHLGNFWRNLNIPLINCEVSIDLRWNDKCMLVRRIYIPANADANPPIAEVKSPSDTTFKITDCKLYVPVVNLSIENENKLFEMLKSGLKRTLLDFNYFKEHYKMIAIDVSKQIELENEDLKQQINFIGNLDRDGGATMFCIIEKQEETVI